MKRLLVVFVVLMLSVVGVTDTMAQDFTWAKQFGGSAEEFAYNVSQGVNGDVYVVGSFQGTVDFDPGAGQSNLTSIGGYDVFVTKLDRSGNFLWAVRTGGISDDFGYSIAQDSAGNVCVIGYFEGTSDFDPGTDTFNLSSGLNSKDAFVWKLSGSGTLVWAKQFDGISVFADAVAVDVNDAIYTVGDFTGGPADFDPGPDTYNLAPNVHDTFITKLDSSGAFVWAKQFGGGGDTFAYGVVVDIDRNVYTVGEFSDTSDFDPSIGGVANLSSYGLYDAYVSKLDSAGNFVWAKQLGGPSDDIARDSALDSSGNLYTVGSFHEEADFNPGTGTFNLTSAGGFDVFVSKLDSSGNFVWAKKLGGLSDDEGNGIDVDADGNVYAVGRFVGTADFDPDAGTFNLISAGSFDVFVSRLDSSGSFVWADQIRGTSADQGNGIDADAAGYVYAVGHFRETADFDPGVNAYNLVALGIRDAFVVKLGPINQDSDNDGFTPAQGDCDDSDPNVRPNATEIPGNGKNDDCDASTLDSGTNELTSHVAFATQPETLIKEATIYLDQRTPSGSWFEVVQISVNPSDGTFSFTMLPDGTYRVRARISWTDRIKTPNGDVNDSRFVEKTSDDIHVKGGHVLDVYPVIFPRPVILVYGLFGGSCIPESIDGQTTINCDSEQCSDKKDYWSTALSTFLSKAVMTFIADGLEPCNAPLGTANFHEYNGEKLGQYIDYVWTKLLPKVVGDKMEVDLVGHSMGGITARAYIARKDMKPLSVRKLAMIATPNAGSINAELASDFSDALFALGRYEMWEFNDLYGTPSSANYVSFASISGSGGSSSAEPKLKFGSINEPHPNDGAVGLQSAVDYNVQDTPLTSENQRFRDNSNCTPQGASHNCLIRIPFEQYLCTADDHSQIKNNAATLQLAVDLLNGQDPNGGVSGASCPPPTLAANKVLLQGSGAVNPITRISSGVVLPLGFTSHTHLIDTSAQSVFSLVWDSGFMNFTLEDPLGGTIDPNTSDPDVTYEESTDPVSGLAAIYTIQNPMSGNWILHLTAGAGGDPNGIDYVATTTSEADVSVMTNVVPGILELGQTTIVSVTASEQGVPIIGGTVAAIVTDRDGIATTLSCADDGVSPDATANDGTFTCSYGPVTSSGIHKISITRSGNRSDTVPFERADVASLAVNASDATFTGTFSESTTDPEPDGMFNTLVIDVDLSVTNAGVFSLSGSLTDPNGQLITTAHVQGEQLATGSQIMSLSFNGTDIKDHGVDGPYTLTDLTMRRSDRDLVPTDTAMNAYTTASYSASDFQVNDPDGDGIATSVDFCPFAADPNQTDADLDGVGNACDNCPVISNAGQADQDYDGFGDLCDLCPTVADSVQGDIDGDMIGDTCDPDIDGDGVANALDCNQLNPTLWSQAPEVTGVEFQSDGQTMTWTPATTADGAQIFYDIVRGDIVDLRQTQTFDKMVCNADNLTAATVIDPSEPQSGHAFYYLIRATTTCSKGSYGTGALGERVIYSCP